MSLKLTTAAALPPVTLAEAKLHLRVDVSDDDTLISALVLAATQACEQATGRGIMPQAWQLSLDAFPSVLELTRVPVTAITSIKYLDNTGADLTLNPSDYVLDNLDDFDIARVRPAFGKSWPAARCTTGSVRVAFAVGYANAAAVPESIKSWIKLQIGAMYENRSAEGPVQTYALGFADRLLDQFKVWKL